MQRSNIHRIIYFIIIITLVMTVTGCKRKNADDGALEVHNSVQDESVITKESEDSLNVVPINVESEPETEAMIETDTETTTEVITTAQETTTAVPTIAQETTTVPPTTVAPTTETVTVPPTTVPPTTKQEATVPPTAPPTTEAPTAPPVVTTEAVTVPETTVPLATEAATVAGNMTSDGSDANPNYVAPPVVTPPDSTPKKPGEYPSWSNEWWIEGDPEGYTRGGPGQMLRDKDGYNQEGYNAGGYDRDGKHWTQKTGTDKRTEEEKQADEDIMKQLLQEAQGK